MARLLNKQLYYFKIFLFVTAKPNHVSLTHHQNAFLISFYDKRNEKSFPDFFQCIFFHIQKLQAPLVGDQNFNQQN